MCGISAILGRFDNLREKVEVMVTAQTHRGPDGRGVFVNSENSIGFGHNRLAIIGLEESGNQPLFSHDKKFVIVFNGEIYNYMDLKIHLEAVGAQFSTNTDTEIILEGFRFWGEDVVRRLRGMFSFLLYDIQKQEVFVARDPFGIKPLYYASVKGGLVFASEPKAIISAFPSLKEEDALTTNLFVEHGFIDRGPWTFFKDLKRFPPGYCGVVKDNKFIKLHRYWEFQRVDIPNSYGECVEKFRELLKDSVRLHMVSDVPVGSCLSGGLDSSSIVALMVNQGGSTQHINTFSVSYEKYSHLDESKWARKVSHHLRVASNMISPTEDDFKESLKEVIYSQDEPFGSATIFSQNQLFKGISERGFKVVLDGQGADEQLAGYQSLINLYLSSRSLFDLNNLRLFIRYRKKAGLSFRSALMKSNEIIAKELSHKSSYDVEIHRDDLEERLHVFSLANYDNFEQYLVNLTLESNLQQLLRYEDRNSMSYSIESRVPFLIDELVRFTLSLPSEFKFNNGYTKSILRDAVANLLPRSVLLRVDKKGFATPEQEWLKSAYGIDTTVNGSIGWRKLVTEIWKEKML